MMRSINRHIVAQFILTAMASWTLSQKLSSSMALTAFHCLQAWLAALPLLAWTIAPNARLRSAAHPVVYGSGVQGQKIRRGRMKMMPIILTNQICSPRGIPCVMVGAIPYSVGILRISCDQGHVLFSFIAQVPILSQPRQPHHIRRWGTVCDVLADHRCKTIHLLRNCTWDVEVNIISSHVLAYGLGIYKRGWL